MVDFNGTDGDDLIDATYKAGFALGDRVFGGEGNDTVTLSPGVTFVSGHGNDIITGVNGGAYALWFDPASVYINLVEGWARDGYGDIDQLSGINEVHLPGGYGATVFGSDIDETVFCFGGDNYIDLGGGLDTVFMYEIDSSSYDIRQAGASVYLFGSDHDIEIRNAESVEFADRMINTVFREDDLFASFQYQIYSFTEDEWSEGWWYADVYNEPQLISYFPQAVNPIDIDEDGDFDLVVPLNKGYRTGVDTRFHFQVIENSHGRLTYSDEMTNTTPFIAGSRRTEMIYLDRYDSKAIVTIAHDTAIETETRYDIPWRFGDISIQTTEPFNDVTANLIPIETLPKSLLTGRNTAVDAHSLAVGDVNGDGMEDILVGEFSGVFLLLQTESGCFTYETSDFLQCITRWMEPTLADATPGLLIDLHLADFNGDGFSDLVAGWGHANVLSRIFFNDGSGSFSLDHSEILPVSIYGAENTLHMKTFSEDFDLDGDLDLIILHSRNNPYYGGNYLQFLENDGTGEFIDATTSRLGDPLFFEDTFGSRLEWTDFWQVLDVNEDNAMDVVGHYVSGSVRTPFIYLNDGTGHFDIVEIPIEGGDPTPLSWGDFNSDGYLEFVAFNSRSVDAEGTGSINSFDVYELNNANLSSDMGVHVGGRITDAQDRALEGVFVNKELISDDRGIWEVDIASNISTELSFSKDYDPDSDPGSIDMGDAFCAFFMAAGIFSTDGRDGAIKTIAADVDKNGVVSFSDAWDIYKYALGFNSDHVGGYSFIDSETNLNSIDKNNVNYDETIALDLPTDDLTIDLMGILLGDINWL